MGGQSFAQQEEQEATLKAAFIYNFTRYIDWEASQDNGDFVIGIIGPSSVTGALNEISKNNTVKNKKITIRIFNKPEDIGSCNILFIPKNMRFPLQSVLDKTGRGVLTISEEPGFARHGTAFNFIIDNNKLKFEANLKVINSSGLKAGSQLLKLAKIID